MTFGERLINLRKQKGKTRIAAADEIGVNVNVLRKYENGQNEPTMTRLIWLADYYGADLNWLTGRNYEYWRE